MVKFIAEVSSNHAQDIDRCKEFVRVAAKSGFDSVKFQLFKIDELFTQDVITASKEHAKRRKWELPVEFLPIIKEECIKNNIKLGITPFYIDAVKESIEYVDYFKIASYEILWLELIEKCALTGKPVIFSTGMAEMHEIENAYNTLIKNKCSDISILHCTSAYPTPPDEVNLSAIETIRKKFQTKIGWSDHSNNESVVISSVLRWGAEIVEIHLDLDGNGEEFAPGHCWLPDSASRIIDICKSADMYSGSGLKVPVPSELNDRDWRADPSDGLRPLKIIR